MRAKPSGGDASGSGEKLLQLVLGHGALAQDAAPLTRKFNDGGSETALCGAGIEDERKPAADLPLYFIGGPAGGLPLRRCLPAMS